MRRRLEVLVTVLAALLLAGAPAAGITNGVPDGNRHPYVGIILVPDDGFCSGSLIAPQAVLTAGHCTAFFDEAGASQLLVSFDADLSVHPTFYTASRWETHPEFAFGNSGLPGVITADLGVVILDRAIRGIPTAQLPEEGVLDGVDQHGRDAQTFAAVGYGTRDFARGGGRPEPTVNGMRMRATPRLLNLHTAVTGDAFVQLPSRRGQRQGGTCFGDSGGPILLDDTDVIVATSSFGANPNCAGVEWDFRIDTAQALDFIRRFL